MPAGLGLSFIAAGGTLKVTPPASSACADCSCNCSTPPCTPSDTPEEFQNRLSGRTRLLYGARMKMLTFIGPSPLPKS